MGYSTISDVVRRWVDVTEGREQKNLTNPRVPVIDGRLYAFDRSFELVRAIKDKRGKVTHYVLNGDDLRTGPWGWGRPTHQWQVRNALTGRRQVIIPFTALEESGVDIDSIKIIDVLPDRNEEIKHHAKEKPHGATWLTEPIMKTFELTREERAEWLKEHPWYDGNKHPGSNYAFTVDTFPGWAKTESRKVGERRVLRVSRSQWSTEITVSTDADGQTWYDWTSHHHWLGESLIKAQVTWTTADGKEHRRWAYFLSGFDHQEPQPLYFFAELPPKVAPLTVEEAYHTLKPEAVLLAEQMDRRITRQGDIFAIAAPSLDRRSLEKMGAVFEKRSQIIRGQRPAELLGTNHRATEVARMPNGVTLARGQLYHDPVGREKDHVARKMGDGQGWHIIIKNTVPDAVVRR